MSDHACDRMHKILLYLIIYNIIAIVRKEREKEKARLRKEKELEREREEKERVQREREENERKQREERQRREAIERERQEREEKESREREMALRREEEEREREREREMKKKEQQEIRAKEKERKRAAKAEKKRADANAETASNVPTSSPALPSVERSAESTTSTSSKELRYAETAVLDAAEDVDSPSTTSSSEKRSVDEIRNRRFFHDNVYLAELLKLQTELMAISDPGDLRQLKRVLDETSELHSFTSEDAFHFDLCALDRQTVTMIRNALTTIKEERKTS